jgi:putative oxidoreductase
MDASLLLPGSASTGILIGRLVIGLLMAAHGAQKLFGWFGGYGLRNTGGFMEQLGYRPGVLFAAAAGLGEVGAGMLVALGFLGPVGPALMISVMIVAAITVHWGNLFATKNGIEMPLLYAVAALVFAFVGYGAYSIDALLGFPSPWSLTATLATVAIGIIGGLANVAIRRRPAPATA